MSGHGHTIGRIFDRWVRICFISCKWIHGWICSTSELKWLWVKGGIHSIMRRGTFRWLFRQNTGRFSYERRDDRFLQENEGKELRNISKINRTKQLVVARKRRQIYYFLYFRIDTKRLQRVRVSIVLLICAQPICDFLHKISYQFMSLCFQERPSDNTAPSPHGVHCSTVKFRNSLGFTWVYMLLIFL